MRKHYLLWLLLALMMPIGAKAQITEFPYVLDFENGLDGWTAIDGDNDGNTWEIFDWTNFQNPPNVSHSGTHSIISRSYNYYALTPDNWLVSPAIELGESPMVLNWWHNTQDPSYPAEHYAVYVSTSGNTVADFTEDPLFEVTMTAADHDWTPNTISLAEYAGQTIYIAFRHFNVSDMFYFHIDDISIEAPASCPMPTNIAYSDITTTSATMTFDYASNAIGADIYLNNNLYTTVTSGTVNFTGLTPGTTYHVKIQQICSTTDSSNVASSGFITLCEDISVFPYTDNFESGNMNCWNYESMYWHLLNDEDYANSGDYSMYTSTANQALITPIIVVPEDASNLKADFYIMGIYDDVTCKIYVSQAGATEFDEDDFTLALTTTASDEYTKVSVPLDAYAGESITLAILSPDADGDDYTYLFVDDFTVRSTNMPTAEIEGPTVADLGSTATFIAHMTEGDSTNIDYTWTSARVAAGEATMEDNDDTLTVTYTAGDTDTITVSIDNGFGIAHSTVYVHLRDCQPIDSFPWIEDFATNASLECWTILDEDGNGASWSRTTSGSGYLHAPYNSAGPDDWAITPAVEIPEEADGLVLSWGVKGNTYSYGVDNFYQVLASPTAGTTAASFTDTLFSESYTITSWVGRTTPVSQYAGQTVRFAFRHVNTGDDNGMDIDSVSVRMSLAPHISLNGPATVQLGDTVNFTAILNEGATNNLTYTFSSLAATAGTADANADNNIYTISYTAEGTDTVKVVATNDHGSDSAMLAVQIIDYNPATLPYTCGFEPADEDSSWFIQNDVNAWYIDTVAHNSGSYGLYISSDTGATNIYTGTNSISYAKRAITFSQAGQHAFSFDWKANGESTYDFLRAFLVPLGTVLPTSYSGIAASTLPSGYIAIDGGSKLNLKTTWQTATNIATIDVPGTYLMVFCWRNDNTTTNNPPAAIDNIAVNVVSCPQPLAIEADSIGSDYLAFHWTPAGSEEAWEVIVDSIATEVTDTVFLAENLDGNTTYTVKVRAICGEEDTSVFTSTQMRTECADITLPYFESFENGGDECWSFATTGSASTTYHSIYNNIAADGTKSLRLFMSNTGNKDYAILPKLENVNTLMITFKNLDYYGDGNTLEVGTMANTSNLASFVPLYSTIGNDDYWDEHEVRFDADTTGNQYIAFRVTAAEGYTYIHLDEINVLVAPSCQRPEGVSVSNIEATSATITVTDSTNVNNYQVIVYNGTDTVYNELITSDSCQVTGLTAATQYSVKAYAICDDGNATTAVNTSFKTLCANGSCEFSVAMADSYGDGWNGSAAILVMQNGELQETVKLSTGSSGTADVSTCLGDSVVVTWRKGSWDAEISFSIADASSETILSITTASNLLNGDTLVVFDGQCGVSYVHTADTTGPVPPQPGCNTPTITSANATDNSITVVWSGNAQSYEVGIAEGAWDSTATITTAAGPSYTFTGLTANTQYVVGVRAVCSDDSTSAWVTRTVSTANVGIADVAAFGFGLHPNPATSSVTVDLGSVNAIVTVIDQSGRTVYSRENASGRLTIDVSQMAKGAYFVRVTGAESTAVRKLIVR